MKLLDLFCGAGGAAMGYYRAGFHEIVGVDIAPQPHYPFHFVQADALTFCRQHGQEFDVIHASPPCQGYSVLNHLHKKDYPLLIEDVRSLLSRKPYIIENVPGSPLQNPLMLCGTMFDLRVIRHRLFETSPYIAFPPACCNHWGKSVTKGVYGIFENGFDFLSVTGRNYRIHEAQEALGIDWMTTYKELSQAIPPAYTEYIGKQMLALLSPKRMDWKPDKTDGLRTARNTPDSRESQGKKTSQSVQSVHLAGVNF